MRPPEAPARGAYGEVLAIIPARGGSKGVPRKNIKPLAGKPLIVWTIETTLRARYITRVIVSTDDDEIARISRAAGAEVLARPAELAQDTTPSEPVFFHVLDTLRDQEGYVPAAFACVQCTTPLRGADVMDECIRLLFESGCDTVMTVATAQHWYLTGRLDAEGRYTADIDIRKRPRSQEMGEKYRENGAFYVLRPETLYRYGVRFGPDVRAVPMDVVRSMDIDSEEDFALCEEVLLGLKIR